METQDIPDKEPSPWVPIDNKIDLAVLGKLAEEVNELGAIIARCIIQGLDGLDPATGKANRDKLAEEIADADAMMDHAVERFKLNGGIISKRISAKFQMKKSWFDILRSLGYD